MSQPSVPAAVPKEVMDAFWKLGDTKDPIRLAAAQKIVAHAQSLKLSAAQPVDQRQDYVLGRLVKGLGSHSRRGFYVALHEILKNTGSEGVARVKQLMKQHLAVKGSKSLGGSPSRLDQDSLAIRDEWAAVRPKQTMS
ncbi:uncharacterized protein LOC131886664 [Tigriopus californicus]|uniref:uncharacterized protein LOC131886664 n=1 Tax=Tigriopus californicus TaxID=6832 RepID=UPI0027D9FD6A|nr:uncharacterized protein LOC131886664 [Tigriopus californicus]